MRWRHCGAIPSVFVFQRYNLISDLGVVENAETPAVYCGMAKTQREVHASDLLRELGLGDRRQHHPNQLSGGQQQRVSIARALMNGGLVILADEPTEALDSQGGKDNSVWLPYSTADSTRSKQLARY